jgi:hypothetical protein
MKRQLSKRHLKTDLRTASRELFLAIEVIYPSIAATPYTPFFDESGLPPIQQSKWVPADPTGRSRFIALICCITLALQAAINALSDPLLLKA